MKMILTEKKIFEKGLIKAGFKSLGLDKENTNGPDLTITKKKRAYTVEIKNCRITKRGSVQVPPVEANRRKDDFIAIKTPCGIVIFETMTEHLSKCTPKGYRTLHVAFK